MIAHFVTFFSPGSFVTEETTKEIPTWDVETAKAMARDITERYGATPFGFRFSTRSRTNDQLDSTVTKKSGLYYLGGTIRTEEEVEAANDPADAILLSNMQSNGWKKVLVNTNSFKITLPLKDEDTVLEWDRLKPGPVEITQPATE